MSRLDQPLTLYPSLRGLLAVLLTPHLLILLGAWGLSAGGSTVALGFVLVGIASAALGLFGYPHRVVVTPDGIQMASVLRRRMLPWDAVRTIERTRPGAAAMARARTAGDGPRPVTGGLLARGHGRRRWMLTDHVESPDEYDHLRAIAAAAPGAPRVVAKRPLEGTPPTSLYRRRVDR
ncbi:PH domain-containing protein [Egicoccus sp. AB-alg6-2]|uniref:PH domain-containing protein n=1 Tax=Egicoccus sp. AB-alg6-2 TaxID=3242692 RepID=UPI00359E36D2